MVGSRVIFNYDEGGREKRKLQRCARGDGAREARDISGQTWMREGEGRGVGEKKIAFAGYRIIRKRFQFEDEKSFAASNKCMA